MFLEWKEGRGGSYKAVLFCSGNPGDVPGTSRVSMFFNKTEFTDGGSADSLVINRLCGQAEEGDIPVACLYCGFLAQ